MTAGGKLYVGRWSMALIALAFMLSGGLMWLSVPGTDSLTNGFMFLFLPGLCLLAITWKEGLTAARANPNSLWTMVALGLIMQFAIQIACLVLFPSSMESTGFSNVLTAFIFAVYEETFYLGFAGLLKMAKMPDIVVIALSMLTFPLMHALAYPSTTAMDLGLAAGRGIFTGMTVVTDNTDAGFLIHALWNVGVTFPV